MAGVVSEFVTTLIRRVVAGLSKRRRRRTSMAAHTARSRSDKAVAHPKSTNRKTAKSARVARRTNRRNK